MQTTILKGLIIAASVGCIQACVDDDATLSSVSSGQLANCASFANFCADDSVLVAQGMPEGYFAGLCPLTCGTCGGEGSTGEHHDEEHGTGEEEHHDEEHGTGENGTGEHGSGHEGEEEEHAECVADLPEGEWPEFAEAVKASGGCGMISTVVGMGITCSEDLALNPLVQAQFPGSTGTLCDLCCHTCATNNSPCHEEEGGHEEEEGGHEEEEGGHEDHVSSTGEHEDDDHVSSTGEDHSGHGHGEGEEEEEEEEEDTTTTAPDATIAPVSSGFTAELSLVVLGLVCASLF